MSVINTKVKPFSNMAFKDGKFIEVTDATIKGKWAVFVFYPGDFTLVCPTELEDIADHHEELKKLGVEVFGVSTDSHYAHKAWHNTSPSIQKVKYPLIGDPSGFLARNFDALDEKEGVAVRGTFVVNPEGVIKFFEVHDILIPRAADDLVRKLKIAQYSAANPDQACPAGWKEGDPTLKISDLEHKRYGT